MVHVQELSRQVSTEEASAFATGINALFFETSAKGDLHVREAFEAVAEKIIDIPELWLSTNATRTDHGRGGVPGGVQLVGSGDASDQRGSCWSWRLDYS